MKDTDWTNAIIVPVRSLLIPSIIIGLMPEVNDDRYDVLKEATNLFYDECKTKMKAAVDKTWADVLFLAPGESKEELEQLKNNIDKGKEMAEQQRDKMYNDKLKEIEDAYKEWLSKLDGQKNRP